MNAKPGGRNAAGWCRLRAGREAVCLTVIMTVIIFHAWGLVSASTSYTSIFKKTASYTYYSLST